MAEINFVRQRLKKLGKLYQQDRKLFNLALIIAGIIFSLFLIVLGIRWYFVSQLKKIDATYANYSEQISLMEDEERSYVILANKLKTLSQILEDRQDKQEAIAYFSQIFGSETIIDQIVYESESKLLAFGVRTVNIFTLEQVFATLASDQTQAKFVELHQSELKRNENGTYQMKVTVVMDADEAAAN